MQPVDHITYHLQMSQGLKCLIFTIIRNLRTNLFLSGINLGIYSKIFYSSFAINQRSGRLVCQPIKCTKSFSQTEITLDRIDNSLSIYLFIFITFPFYFCFHFHQHPPSLSFSLQNPEKNPFKASPAYSLSINPKCIHNIAWFKFVYLYFLYKQIP